MKRISCLAAAALIFIYLLGGSVVIIQNISHYSLGDFAVVIIVYGLLILLEFKLIQYFKAPSKPQQAESTPADPLSPPPSEEDMPEKSSTPPLPEIPKPTEWVEIQTQRIDEEAEYPAFRSSPLNYLDSRALRFWANKRTDFQIPAYYAETAFGRNLAPARERLLSDGYLTLGNMEQRIALKKVPELKAILSDKELKVSGTKKELIYRILEHFDPDALEDLFPVNVYKITEKGESALAPYSIVDANAAHSLGLSYYRLLQAKEENPGKTDNEILTQLLSEDIQRCYCEQNRSGYQNAITTTGRFMREIGEVQLSFDCFSLSFFMWTRDIEQLEMTNAGPQSFYLAKNLEEIGRLCGYDLEQLAAAFREAISQNDPFALGTSHNIEHALRIFKESLGVK